ncbi:YwaF family protein [Paenibacillus harenae]|uniref:YwaF family protein n=1 Tax=Paenibacillus harenae TaxID=306543 RepID=UPI002793176B|nr:TIGR02206 family membrane protein [Paenibacillus harenae]MDQ0059369.1 putative integral membrane protein (TIGR02206 family) [Paenibacillus harenae]
MSFEMFSAAHYAALLAAAVVFAWIVLQRRKLRVPSVNRTFRWVTASVLIGCEVALQASYLIEGEWSYGSLPLQLCSLTLLLAAALLMTGSKRLYDIVFFLGILGALQALITPNLGQDFPHFRYFHFFIAHIGIIAAGLFVIAVERYRPTYKSVCNAWIWLHILAVPAAAVNYMTGYTNFMFLARKPGTASLLDMLAPWPWYILQLEVVVIALCLLLLWVVALVRRIKG